jgi:hypothetical protein
MTRNLEPAQRLAAVLAELGTVTLLIMCRVVRAMSEGDLDGARESWMTVRTCLDSVLRVEESASRDARRH